MSKAKTKKPLLLCILDGWGIGDTSNPANAIAKANTPNYDRFLKHYPHSGLETSGLAVGLPEGQIGNSEVGHMTIGSGRVIFQDLPKINNAIADGSLVNNPTLQKLITDLKTNNKACHLMGLFSDGGVHSHIDHILYLYTILTQHNIKTYIHAFLDGRDVAQKSALSFFHNDLNIATISGRYWAMDRDNNWDRVKLAYDAIMSGACENFDNVKNAINASYSQDITDEFIKPCKINNYPGINDDDAVIFCNFRADRARQISNALIN
ncbi:MAG: 2,3-bisphosphoglycerate-independent phosphoglycerate mutase, partial [Rickettsiales bacterium]|nr:2,3-bisphosphoglycerate-independent phosphoglycerate mutase [Rickettsiales bacterium]